jgi:hydrogenase maturation factor HypE
MSNKQTAVEWLVKELNQKIDFIPLEKWDMIRDIIQQAKELEKEQMIEFALAVLMEAYATVEGNVTTELTIQEYYNLKYGK